MSLRYLIDENMHPSYKKQLLLKNPNLIVHTVGDPGFPPRGTLDPEILHWCEANNRVLITNNRHSMPIHLKDHITEGYHIPGIIMLNPDMSIGETIEELILITEATLEGEYQDRIVYLPVI